MCSFKGISPLILLFAVPLITSTKQLPGDGADDDLIRVVHRPNSSLALTSSSTPSVVVPVPELASQPRSRPTLLGGRKSTSLVGLGGNGRGGAAAAGLVLNEGKRMPKTARFFGIRTTVQNIVCYFARNGAWPRYPREMRAPVEQMSRQIFELDDDRVRIFCRRPPVPVNRPPFNPASGPCCRPSGGGGIYPTRGPTSSTTKFDTETINPDDYETYTGTGTGSYTGEEDNYEYGRLGGAIKGHPRSSPKPKRKRMKTSTTTTRPTPVVKGRAIRSLRSRDIVVPWRPIKSRRN